jgi:hypothetical protein
MIIFNKKTLFIIFIIFFLINIFLILKRREFNFNNFKYFLRNENYQEINKHINGNVIDSFILFAKKEGIKEINFDKSILKDYNIHDLIFHFYPIKYNNNSKYIFSYEKKSYSHCINYHDTNKGKLKKFATLYFCK